MKLHYAIDDAADGLKKCQYSGVHLKKVTTALRAHDHILLVLVPAAFTVAGILAIIIVAPPFAISAAALVTALATALVAVCATIVVVVDGCAQDRRADQQAEHGSGFLIVRATAQDQTDQKNARVFHDDPRLFPAPAFTSD